MILDDSFQKEFKGVIMGNQKRDSAGKSQGESSPNTSHTMTPKNSGTFANGDPFLTKLQEIDCDQKV